MVWQWVKKDSGNFVPCHEVIQLVKTKLELKYCPSDSLNPLVSRCLAICPPWACFPKWAHPATTLDHFPVGKISSCCSTHDPRRKPRGACAESCRLGFVPWCCVSDGQRWQDCERRTRTDGRDPWLLMVPCWWCSIVRTPGRASSVLCTLPQASSAHERAVIASGWLQCLSEPLGTACWGGILS